MRLDEQAVHFRTTIGDAVDLVFPRHANMPLIAGPCRIDVAVEHRFAAGVGGDDGLAEGIAEAAAADERHINVTHLHRSRELRQPHLFCQVSHRPNLAPTDFPQVQPLVGQPSHVASFTTELSAGAHGRGKRVCLKDLGSRGAFPEARHGSSSR